MSLFNYIKNEKKELYIKSNEITSDNNLDNNLTNNYYNFDEVMDYYDNRDEFDFVGIVDKELNRRKNKRDEDIEDVFKIREKREKILDKKRGTGIPSLKGAVCATSKNKQYLEELASKIGINLNRNKELKRDELCQEIKNKLIHLEKHSKGKKKITYIMIPKNHSIYKFPLNIEDRIEYLKKNIENIINSPIKFNSSINNNKNNINLSFTIDKKLSKDEINKIKNEGWSTKDNNKWTILID